MKAPIGHRPIPAMLSRYNRRLLQQIWIIVKHNPGLSADDILVLLNPLLENLESEAGIHRSLKFMAKSTRCVVEAGK
ncbi:MAG: hypothetical protein ACRC62_23475 [Microcoleus sp.]